MDPKICLVVNSKGGVGKSTLSLTAIREFTKSGIRFSYYDVDGQHTSVQDTVECENAEVVWVDTAGIISTDIINTYMPIADLIIIPTKLSVLDRESLQKMIQISLKNAHCQLLIVLNGWTRFGSSKSFINWFKSIGDYDYVVIPNTEYFPRSIEEGCSVLDIAPHKSKAYRWTKKYIEKIYDYLELDKGK